VKTTLVCSDARPEVKLSGVARQRGRRPRTVTFRATSRSPTLPRKLSHRWDEQERMLGVALALLECLAQRSRRSSSQCDHSPPKPGSTAVCGRSEAFNSPRGQWRFRFVRPVPTEPRSIDRSRFQRARRLIGEQTARRLDLEALGDRSIAMVSCRSAHAFAAVQEWSFELVALAPCTRQPRDPDRLRFWSKSISTCSPHSMTRHFKGRRSPS
jgi:hypothetical protein